ncbi:hypothetical protein ACDW_40670 [Acidovorax sp. DW039]|nr:hypothetical protein ACDW_40670 [Acidovorax sp. DW039]
MSTTGTKAASAPPNCVMVAKSITRQADQSAM